MKSTIKMVLGIIAIGFAVLRIFNSSNRVSRFEQNEKKAVHYRLIKQIVKDTESSLVGDWIGLEEFSQQEYKTELSFKPNKQGKRTIYISDSCSFEQSFTWVILSGLTSNGKEFGMWLHFPSDNISEYGCEENTSASLTDEITIQRKMQIGLEKDGKISLKPFVRKENIRGNSTNSEVGAKSLNQKALVKSSKNLINNTTESDLLKINKIANELESKIVEVAGGFDDPTISINPETYEITITTYFGEEPIGELILEKEQYFILSNYWQHSNYFAKSGIWKQVPFINSNGQEKVGDLIFCFDATSDKKYSLKEF